MAATGRFNIGARDKSAATFSKITARLKFLGGAALAVAGVGGFGILIKSSLTAGDALAKSAAKFDIATEKLAGLQRAAKLTGVENNTLEKGLQNMVRNIADFADGTGEAKAELEKLGFTSADLINLSADQQFAALAEAIDGVENSTEKVNIAYSIFGGRATALLNTLALNRDGLAQVNEQADILGTALSADQARIFEDVNDSFTNMQDSLRGMANQIIVNTGPAVTALMNTLAVELPSVVPAFREAFLEMQISVGETVASFLEAGSIAERFRAKISFGRVSEIAAENARALQQRALDLRNAASADRRTIIELADNNEKLRKVFEFKPGKPVAALPAADTGASGAEEKEFARFEASLLTKEEKLAGHYQKRAELVALNVQGEGEAALRRNELMLGLEGQYQAELLALHSGGLVKMKSFDQASFKDRAQATAQFFAGIFASAATHNRAAFNIHKIASISQGLLDLRAAISGAYKVGARIGGPPLGAAFGAAAGLAQGANLAAIKNTQFGGGGGAGGGAGGGGAVPTFNADPVFGLPQSPGDSVAGAGGTQNVSVINIYGDTLSGAGLDKFIDTLADRVESGDKVLIRRNSRNALELAEVTV